MRKTNLLRHLDTKPGRYPHEQWLWVRMLFNLALVSVRTVFGHAWIAARRPLFKELFEEVMEDYFDDVERGVFQQDKPNRS